MGHNLFCVCRTQFATIYPCTSALCESKMSKVLCGQWMKWNFTNDAHSAPFLGRQIPALLRRLFDPRIRISLLYFKWIFCLSFTLFFPFVLSLLNCVVVHPLNAWKLSQVFFIIEFQFVFRFFFSSSFSPWSKVVLCQGCLFPHLERDCLAHKWFHQLTKILHDTQSSSAVWL